jgi:hypothetical protein
MLAILVIGGSGGYMMWQQTIQQQKDAQTAAAARKGGIVIFGLPDGGQVLIQNVLYGNGQTVTLDSGTYAASASAPGYQSLQKNISVLGGKIDTVDLTMEALLVAANAANNAAPQAPTQGGNQRNASSGGSSAPRDSNQVRLRVSPNYAEMFVDERNIGTNFKQVWLSIGTHTVRFQAPGCGQPITQSVDVTKTGQAIIVPTVTIPGC